MPNKGTAFLNRKFVGEAKQEELISTISNISKIFYDIDQKQNNKKLKVIPSTKKKEEFFMQSGKQ
jgi:hypothetical protein